MAKNFDDDEYVAELLKQDAKNATKKYELVGIDAFNPRRANAGAPKLNKNFLRNIIRQTDRHNAALLAKEAESRARLKTMDRERNRGRARSEEEQERRAPGRLTPVSGDDDLPKARSNRRRDYSEDEDKHKRRRRRSKQREASKSATSHRHRERSRDRKRHKRRYESEEEDRSRRKRRRSRSYERTRRHKGSDTEDDRRPRRKDRDDRRHKRRRSHSTTSPSRSASPRSDKDERRHKHRGRSFKDMSKSPERKSNRKHRPSLERRAASPANDSDPLEAIVGPLPPPPEPTVRSKGRGAFKSNSMGIESRFSSTYDPTIDVCVGSDNEDDWGDALEALRDRSRWKQQGAGRLRAAGFTDEQVKKWERGEEQTEEDVVWKGKGEAREWDRGKVVDEDGDVGLETDFGRLK